MCQQLQLDRKNGFLGISNTLSDLLPEQKEGKARFSVAIIPYTFEHTNFKSLKKGDIVNLEFDVIGKYVAKYLQLYK